VNDTNPEVSAEDTAERVADTVPGRNVPDTTPDPTEMDVGTAEDADDTRRVSFDTIPTGDGEAPNQDAMLQDVEPEEEVSVALDAASGEVTDSLVTEDSAGGEPVEPLVCPDEAKIQLSPLNPEQFEFYELCIPMDAEPALISSLQALDPTLYCGLSGVFAQCGAKGLQGCHGELSYVAGSKVLTDDTWSMLCDLAALDAVTVIAGGHFL
jgi:hypothetical protein